MTTTDAAWASMLGFGAQKQVNKTASSRFEEKEKSVAVGGDDEDEVWLFGDDDVSLPTTISSSTNASISIRSSALEVGLSNSSLLWPGSSSLPKEHSYSPWLNGQHGVVGSPPPPSRGLPPSLLLGALTTKPLSSSMLTEVTAASTMLGDDDNDGDGSADENKKVARVVIPQEVISRPSALHAALMAHDEELENLPSFSDSDDDDDDEYHHHHHFNSFKYPSAPPPPPPPPLPSLLLSQQQLQQKTQRWEEQINDHQLRRLVEEQKRLEGQLQTLRDDLVLSKQSAIEFEQENVLLKRQMQRLEEQLVVSAQTLQDSERLQLQKSSQWKQESDKLQMDLGNVKRHLEALKFAYNQSRDTHTMDLDLCGDQVWALSDHVQKQRIVISKLSNENMELKKIQTATATSSHTPTTTTTTNDEAAIVKDLQSRLDVSSATIAELKISLDNQVHETNAIHQEKTILLSDQKQSKETIALLQTKLAKVQNDESSLQKLLSDTTSSLQKKISDLQRRCDASSTQISSLEASLEAQVRKTTAMTVEKNLLVSDQTKSKETITLLQTKLAKLDKESSLRLSETKQSFQTEIADLQCLHNASTALVSHLEAKLDAQVREATSLKNEHDARLLQLQQLSEQQQQQQQQKSKQNDEAIALLEAKLSKFEQETKESSEKLFAAYKELKMTTRRFEEERETLLDRISDLEVQLAKAKYELKNNATAAAVAAAARQSKSDAKTASISSSSTKPGHKKSEESFVDRRARLKKKVRNKLSNVYKNLQSSFRKLEDENESLRDRIADTELQNRLEQQDLEDQNECLRDRIVDLEEEHSNLRQVLQDNIEHHDNKIRNIQVELNDAKVQLELSEQEKRHWRDEFNRIIFREDKRTADLEERLAETFLQTSTLLDQTFFLEQDDE